jgi:hypothetical protein
MVTSGHPPRVKPSTTRRRPLASEPTFRDQTAWPPLMRPPAQRNCGRRCPIPPAATDLTPFGRVSKELRTRSGLPVEGRDQGFPLTQLQRVDRDGGAGRSSQP